jgi:stress-induced-phosphoprotein 1
VNPKWGKGWARKGAALHGARRYDEAIEAYQNGLAVEDSPAIRKGLQEVQEAKGSIPIIDYMFTLLISRKASEGTGAFGKMFSDPNLLGKLAANPRTQKHLADPSFVQKVRDSHDPRCQILNAFCRSNCISKILNWLRSQF